VFDHKLKEFLALKVIRNKKRFHKQAIVEVRLLDHLKTNDPEDNKNIIKMKDYFLWRKHLVSIIIKFNLFEY
jgi:dual specificity tyrosine-phosphorylation-regulated kinase 2/3/4